MGRREPWRAGDGLAEGVERAVDRLGIVAPTRPWSRTGRRRADRVRSASGSGQARNRPQGLARAVQHGDGARADLGFQHVRARRRPRKLDGPQGQVLRRIVQMHTGGEHVVIGRDRAVEQQPHAELHEPGRLTGAAQGHGVLARDDGQLAGGEDALCSSSARPVAKLRSFGLDVEGGSNGRMARRATGLLPQRGPAHGRATARTRPAPGTRRQRRRSEARSSGCACAPLASPPPAGARANTGRVSLILSSQTLPWGLSRSPSGPRIVPASRHRRPARPPARPSAGSLCGHKFTPCPSRSPDSVTDTSPTCTPTRAHRRIAGSGQFPRPRRSAPIDAVREFQHGLAVASGVEHPPAMGASAAADLLRAEWPRPARTHPRPPRSGANSPPRRWRRCWPACGSRRRQP